MQGRNASDHVRCTTGGPVACSTGQTEASTPAAIARMRQPSGLGAAAPAQNSQLGAQCPGPVLRWAVRPLHASRSGCKGRCPQKNPAEPLVRRGVLGDDGCLRALTPGARVAARKRTTGSLVRERLAPRRSAPRKGRIGQHLWRAREGLAARSPAGSRGALLNLRLTGKQGYGSCGSAPSCGPRF